MILKTDISFPDILMVRRLNNLLGHSVYRWITHTDRYLHTHRLITSKTNSAA